LIIRRTKFVHQALAEITPLRDIFASLFFVSLGMLLDPMFIVNNWASILAAVAIIFVIKMGVIFTIVRLFGYSNRVSLLVGAGLFQLGEFGFILAQGGFNSGVISEYFYSLILASAVITMVLTPLVMGVTGRIYQRVIAISRKRALNAVSSGEKSEDASSRSESLGRIVIAGYGEVGISIAESLREARIPYMIIEDDPNRVSDAKSEGHPRIFGDATNINVLRQADLSNARVLVVAYPDFTAIVNTVTAARYINPEITIIVRANHQSDREELVKLGVKSVIVPEREAGYTITKNLLKISELDSQERSRVLSILRTKH
jgi:CPA2 family monovalent cation:H+ antiporter-2